MGRAVRAFVGLGANLGDSVAALAAAARAMDELPGTRVVARSSVYVSAPVDATGPDYLNAVVALDSAGLSALGLLRELQRIELSMGRQRPYRHAPRTLDLDLLLWGELESGQDELVLPHPRLHLRAFVLEPLCELAPDLVQRELGPLSLWRARAAGQGVKRIEDPQGWSTQAL